jgi:VanZ family protein
MILIFQGSQDQQSWTRSSRILEPFFRWLLPTASPATIDTAVLLVRKCAHVAEFAVLALLVWWAQRKRKTPVTGGWSSRRALLTLLVVVFYASTDELHQSFVPSRQGAVLDVFIDSCGAILALSFLYALSRVRGRGRYRQGTREESN